MNGLAVITIEGQRGYVNGSIAMLNLEDTSRGLGFTTVATSGNEVIRWNRVTKYLKQIAETLLWCKEHAPNAFTEQMEQDYLNLVNTEYKPEYISESVFYMLAQKANNDAARAFQLTVAYKICPAIHAQGYYSILPTQELYEEIGKRLNGQQELVLREYTPVHPRSVVASAIPLVTVSDRIVCGR